MQSAGGATGLGTVGSRDDGFVREDQERHGLRAGFDGAAEDFHRTRPVCPAQVFDDLMGLAGLAPGDRVVEIGCGTGQATVPLAERGLAITAVELGAELADVARRRLRGFPAVDLVTSSFETWTPTTEAPVDAVVAFSSLHWVDPPLRYAKPHALLRPGGALVVGGCLWARPAGGERFWTEVQADYRAVGYQGDPPPPPEQIGPQHFPAEAGVFFEEVASRRYRFQKVYSAQDYLAILATQSGTHALGPARRADFLDRVRERLEALGGPELTASFVAFLVVGRRRPTDGTGSG